MPMFFLSWLLSVQLFFPIKYEAYRQNFFALVEYPS
jgi:hypothetical protein